MLRCPRCALAAAVPVGVSQPRGLTCGQTGIKVSPPLGLGGGVHEAKAPGLQHGAAGGPSSGTGLPGRHRHASTCPGPSDDTCTRVPPAMTHAKETCA